MFSHRRSRSLCLQGGCASASRASGGRGGQVSRAVALIRHVVPFVRLNNRRRLQALYFPHCTMSFVIIWAPPWSSGRESSFGALYTAASARWRCRCHSCPLLTLPEDAQASGNVTAEAAVRNARRAAVARPAVLASPRLFRNLIFLTETQTLLKPLTHHVARPSLVRPCTELRRLRL